jgi:hypothetical protein
MRTLLTTALVLLVASTAWSQLTITGSYPAEGATNVPLSTTIAIAFSAPIDTNGAFSFETNLLTNVTNVTARYYSAQQDTVFFDAQLGTNTAYFFCVYSIKSKTGGLVQQVPFGLRFTTGSTFPPYSISGTVTQGTTSFSPANALVAIATTPFEDKPNVIMGAIADGSGSFTVSYIDNGAYYTAAAKDMTGDGTMDPSYGDAVGFGPNVIINNGNVTGITIAFQDFPPVSWTAALDSVNLYIGSLPADRQLRWVSCWDADSLGATRDSWQFNFISPSHPGTATRIEVRTGGTFVSPLTDPGWVNWLEYSLTELPALSGAATADVFVTKVEQAGGTAYRNQSKPGLRFLRTLSLGRLANGDFWGFTPPLDPNTHYWGAHDHWVEQVSPDMTIDREGPVQYVGDFATGNLYGVTAVDEHQAAGIPDAFRLEQNYPNPFNPSTTIAYDLPTNSKVKLVVYNVIGQEVAVLVDEVQQSGYKSVDFNASSLPSGVYLYKLTAGNFAAVKKLVVLK